MALTPAEQHAIQQAQREHDGKPPWRLRPAAAPAAPGRVPDLFEGQPSFDEVLAEGKSAQEAPA